ncbi:hypothetical protein GCM10010471_21810 [Leucobacter komagatae]
MHTSIQPGDSVAAFGPRCGLLGELGEERVEGFHSLTLSGLAGGPRHGAPGPPVRQPVRPSFQRLSLSAPPSVWDLQYICPTRRGFGIPCADYQVFCGYGGHVLGGAAEVGVTLDVLARLGGAARPA